MRPLPWCMLGDGQREEEVIQAISSGWWKDPSREWYRQVKIRKGLTVTTSWVLENLAVVGKELTKDGDSGWKVYWVSDSRKDHFDLVDMDNACKKWRGQDV